MTRTARPPSFERLLPAIETALDAALPIGSPLSRRLVNAMRYAARSGGKRLRPLLTCAVCEALTGNVLPALAPAAAVELVHAYSLVHDDLPAMDDDVLRRGQPTCHVAFDEATAILAGDALLTLAFDTLATAPLFDERTRLRMVRLLATAAGWNGMVGGQALDIESTGSSIELTTLERMHGAKTGALIVAAVQLGALAAGADEAQYAALTRFAQPIGFAFQMMDDVLDATSTTDTLGKTAGTDANANKTTYASLLGIDETRTRANEQLTRGLSELASIRIGGTLAEIAEYIVRRSH